MFLVYWEAVLAFKEQIEARMQYESPMQQNALLWLNSRASTSRSVLEMESKPNVKPAISWIMKHALKWFACHGWEVLFAGATLTWHQPGYQYKKDGDDRKDDRVCNIFLWLEAILGTDAALCEWMKRRGEHVSYTQL